MDKSKIGILTFHNALSYGAKLQAYALQQFLRELGVANDIIDYQCEHMYKRHIRPIRVDPTEPIKSFLRSLLTMGQVKKERVASEEFIRAHMQLSRRFDKRDIAQAADEYRAFIAGSDQVWSPTVVGFDKVYFLDFARPEQKYSYAASIGGSPLDESTRREYTRLLSDYQMLSVREPQAAQLVEELTGRTPAVCVDPTLLFDREKWNQITVSCAQVPKGEPYIFLFNVNPPKELFAYALELSKKTKLPVYSIQKNRRQRIDGIHYLDPVTANEFLGLIRDAAYVVTNSFHATVFSVIYHKEFAVELSTRGTRNTRSEALLHNLGIEGREILNAQTPASIPEADWEAADDRLRQMRQASVDYLIKLKEALS